MTTLTAISDVAMLEKNIDAVVTPLTDREREVKEVLESQFFSQLSQSHWEGVELKEYLKQLQSVDIE